MDYGKTYEMQGYASSSGGPPVAPYPSASHGQVPPPAYSHHASHTSGPAGAGSHVGHGGHTPHGGFVATSYGFSAAVVVRDTQAHAGGSHLEGGAASTKMTTAPPGAPRYNDVWALLLFLATLAAFIGVAVVGFLRPIASEPFLDQAVVNEWAYSLLLTSGVAVILGSLYTLLMRWFTKIMLVGSIFLSVALMIAYAVYFFIAISWIVGLFFILFACLYAFLLYTWRHRIDFAVALAQDVLSTMAAFPSSVGVAAVGIVLQLGLTVLYVFAFVYAFGAWSGAALAIIGIFFVFAYFWAAQVIQNVVHVAIAGLFATVYFLTNTGNFPANPMLKSIRRATTYSLGSICFGSLLIALVQTLYVLLRALARGHWCLELMVICIMRPIEALMRYFNHYVFTEISIYGKAYCSAARDTVDLFKRAALDIVANDNLLGQLLNVASLLIGFVGFGIGWAWAYYRVTSEDYGYVLLFAFSGFLVSLLIMSVITSTVNSGVSATIVSLAEDPQALARNRPEVYRLFRSTYQTLNL